MPEVSRVMHFLFENFSRDIAMAEVASLVGMSDSVFSRFFKPPFFKQSSGNSFVRYLNTLRINRAAELLHSTDLPVSNICFEVGFNNLSNFNRQFIQRQKVTPTAYRQRFLDTLQQL
ncbi:helix-turn-helix domain-containing protein [Pokkaliibacter plantistimulans]|uniref:helix-turn-helix domain-containing protein n=1 Tax=Pokkaliibacter plantistimulans TaxID=1635171 RepID=UPI001402A1E8|nr:AraC family transcriptional regulator [Pokkaliibacter plantistimulans]